MVRTNAFTYTHKHAHIYNALKYVLKHTQTHLQTDINKSTHFLNMIFASRSPALLREFNYAHIYA